MRRTRSLTLCALFAALTVVCAQIQIPIQPVAMSMALLAVHLTAALLTPAQAAAVTGVYNMFKLVIKNKATTVAN